ncbi:Calx-beta domain-containing protein [Psychroserpens sp. SPM9]|uniref:Calx-beta domain-containing protein n=1 Tax=Psychroserpens sp. SPM9 TaxID=2975598 RepID=UPI0021A70DD9|nr:Calx-beta domain-containing protein [Psychroserpens sp. SPM9]MDG5490068.1 Calx-beta domain-containing protein [Psychroserpens sp. SPM9]
MNTRLLLLSIIALIAFTSCEEDDENLNGTGVVNFSITELVEVENATDPLVINVGIDNFNHSGGTIEVTISGADYGSDYDTSTGSATFTLDVSPQSLVSTFSIIPIDDDLIETDKVLTITLSSVTGALELGDNTTLTFTILDNDNPLIAMVGFENEADQIEENSSNPLTINIPFDQATTDGGTITVSSSGAAVYGTDYTIEGQSAGDFSITVPAGATSASFNVLPIDNADFESDKLVAFTISEVSGGLSAGVTTQTVVTILNDDSPPNPVIDFSASNTLTFNEDAGTVTLNFEVSDQTTSDATIELTTSGTADASDFNFSGSNANPYTFVIPSGSTTGSVDITMVDDAVLETDETIVLTITSVTGGLDFGVNLLSQTLTLIDNDDVAFNYVETFETATDLASIGYESFLLPAQDLPNNKKFNYNQNAGKYSDVDDVTQSSDSGLVVFYSNTQNGNGTLDNLLITPIMDVTGDVTVSIDITYSQAPQFNNAVVTFYYSETYDGSGTWNESEWIVMGSETAEGLNTNGFGTNDYKRKVMNITSNDNFYVAVRVNQTIDDTFWKTQWRLDNFKVYN